MTSKPQHHHKFRVEKGIPIPSGGREAWKHAYPLLDMEPGDSFAVPAEHSKKVIAAMAMARRAEPSLRFASRATADGGRRVWRLK